MAEGSGVTCWVAPRDVIPGKFYGDAIVRAIDAATAVVLVLSKDSVASSHCMVRPPNSTYLTYNYHLPHH